MSSLILVSPRKSGKAETGLLDVTKFMAAPVPSRVLGTTGVTFYPMYIRWVGDRFVVLGRLDSTISSFKRVWHVWDAAAGFDGNGTAQAGQVPGTFAFGIEHGNDLTTMVAAQNTGGSTATASTVCVSYDLGVNWVSKSLTTTTNWRHPVRGWAADGVTPVWLIHSAGATLIRKSTDNGQTWVAKTAKDRGNIAYSPTLNRWIQMGYNGAPPWYSDDAGETWVAAVTYGASGAIPITFARQYVFNYTSVRWINDRFIAVEDGVAAIMYSFDGKNWLQAGYPALDATATHVIYGAGLWLICAENSNTYAYSVDGVTWARTAFPAGFLFAHGDYGNGKFLFTDQAALKVYYYEFG